eukprot:4301268-Prymnesium_polylepis.2
MSAEKSATSSAATTPADAPYTPRTPAHGERIRGLINPDSGASSVVRRGRAAVRVATANWHRRAVGHRMRIENLRCGLAFGDHGRLHRSCRRCASHESEWVGAASGCRIIYKNRSWSEP